MSYRSCAVGPSTALRTSGRSIETIRTGPWSSTATVMSPAGDSRDDRHGDSVGDLGVETVEVPHVVVVDEDVDELAQSAVLVDEALAAVRDARPRAPRSRRTACRSPPTPASRHPSTGASWWGFERSQTWPPRYPARIPTRQVGIRRALASADVRIRKVVAAPDKFKGTITAAEVARAIGQACWDLGVDCVEVPMADGGDGHPRSARRPEPHIGRHRTARRSVAGAVAPVEGHRRDRDGPRQRAGDRRWRRAQRPARRDRRPARANSSNTPSTPAPGGSSSGLGGSATTDGGFGAIRAITRDRSPQAGGAARRVRRATTLVHAGRQVFGPQKGASPAEVKLLTRRLERLAQMFLEEFGSTSPRSRAAVPPVASAARWPHSVAGSFPGSNSSPTNSISTTTSTAPTS